MLYKEYIKISYISLHRIGNFACQEGVEYSKQILDVDIDLREILKTYFIVPFKNEECYHFSHVSDLSLNEIYSYSKSIFSDNRFFHEQSKNIARFLYEKSSHPNIKRGELYVVYFKDCILDGDTVDAIGIFKSENKDTFIRINTVADGFSIESQTGININKLDKGCLIFNTSCEDGFKVFVVDNSNKGEAKYWVDDFLQVKRVNDACTQTQNVVSMCKTFISQLPNEMAKSEKAAMMNRVIGGINSERVNVEKLAEIAFGKDTATTSFKTFREDYQLSHEVSFEPSFESKPESIKRNSAGSMTTIKLDKNFDIKIHGGEQFIEQGYDKEKAMKFYKLYFQEEK